MIHLLHVCAQRKKKKGAPGPERKFSLSRRRRLCTESYRNTIVAHAEVRDVFKLSPSLVCVCALEACSQQQPLISLSPSRVSKGGVLLWLLLLLLELLLQRRGRENFGLGRPLQNSRPHARARDAPKGNLGQRKGRRTNEITPSLFFFLARGLLSRKAPLRNFADGRRH